MGVKMIVLLYCVCSIVLKLASAQAGLSVFCQRFPTNSNCRSSSSSSSSTSVSSSSSTNTQPVNPSSVGLPPPPGQGQGQQPPPSSGSSSGSGDPCSSWKPVYEKYCVNGNTPAEYQASCGQFQQMCLGGAGAGAGTGASGQPAPNSDPCASWRPVYDKYCTGASVQADYQASCAQFAQKCLGGAGSGVNPSGAGVPPSGLPPPGSGTQPAPQGSGVGSTWQTLTEKAQADQAQQALIDAQNGAANCGQYKDNYNVWCGGVKQVNPVYCNTLGRVCSQQAQQAAAGQSTFGGPFAGSGGLPTGGAGSTRPLTIGNNFGVGPFFGMGKSLGINPLQGVGKQQSFNVPIAGIGVQSSSGVDWGGLPGVAQLGAALGGRRRRWALPVGVDRLGNVIYFIH